jgi:hypothetical protein
MAISDAGRPIHTDATMKIRPRIFLEGNFFVDIRPGTGRAPEVHAGGTIPVTQTATPVQLDQILSALTTSTRDQLKVLLDEYATGLRGGGAQALHDSFPFWKGAFEGVAVVAEAARGVRPNDLSRFIRAQARVSSALASRDVQLADLVTRFRRTVGALADRQADVAASVRGLDRVLRVAHPALGEVDRALPTLRAFTADARPALRAAPETLDLAQPLLLQLDRLLKPGELPRLIATLRPAVRDLAALEPDLVRLFDRVRPVTDCVRDRVLPVLETKLDDGDLSTGRPVWQDFLHGMVGLASASQNFDGDGFAVRYHGGYGDQLFSTGQVPQVGQLFGLAPAPLLGSRPRWPGPGREPPFRPDVACTSQAPPNLAADVVKPAVASRRVGR